MGKTDDLLKEYKSIKNRMMELGNKKCEYKTGAIWRFGVIVSAYEREKEKTNDQRAEEKHELSDQAKEELAMTIARDDYNPTVRRYELEAFVKAMEKSHVDRPVNVTVINRCKIGNEEWKDYTKRSDKTMESTCELRPGNHRGYEHEDRHETEMAMFELGIKKRQDELTPGEWEKIADWKRHFHKFDIKSGPNCNEWEQINDPWYCPCKSKK